MRLRATKVMAMADVLSLWAAMSAGVVLGGMFFGGLWWTVRKAMSSDRPALWFFGSLISRMSIALLGFFAVGREDWSRWLLCLFGFALARLAVQFLTRPSRDDASRSAVDAGYAP
jgi:F1F0 ATPase subunit 2